MREKDNFFKIYEFHAFTVHHLLFFILFHSTVTEMRYYDKCVCQRLCVSYFHRIMYVTFFIEYVFLYSIYIFSKKNSIYILIIFYSILCIDLLKAWYNDLLNYKIWIYKREKKKKNCTVHPKQKGVHDWNSGRYMILILNAKRYFKKWLIYSFY